MRWAVGRGQILLGLIGHSVEFGISLHALRSSEYVFYRKCSDWWILHDHL